jgi:hypothetical protein
MTWVATVQAIQTKFRNEWNLTPLTHVAFENEPFDVPNDEEWVYVEIMGGRGEIAGYGGMGSNLIRRDGIVMVHAFVPLNSGGNRALQLVENGAAIFQTASFSGIQFWALYPPSPPSGDSELGNRAVNGSWWRTYCSVPFQYDEVM